MVLGTENSTSTRPTTDKEHDPKKKSNNLCIKTEIGKRKPTINQPNNIEILCVCFFFRSFVRSFDYRNADGDRVLLFECLFVLGERERCGRSMNERPLLDVL